VAKKKESAKMVRKQIIAKAIADPSFRRKLLSSPEVVFGTKMTKGDIAALESMKLAFPAMDTMITSLAGEVLCGGGGCGGLA
jgi:hypothetical protein